LEKLGIFGFVTKPVIESELLDVLLRVENDQKLIEVEKPMKNNRRHPSRLDHHGEEEVLLLHRPLQILLAEDNIVNTKLATRLLEKLGHQVKHAENGLQATKMAAANDFDVILMDVQMPEMGGFDATKIIRFREMETGKHVPVIAVTAHALQGDREKCIEAGMDDYISKPIHIDQLGRMIEKWTSCQGDYFPRDEISSPQLSDTHYSENNHHGYCSDSNHIHTKRKV